MQRKTSSRLAVVLGGLRRRSATRPESTLGAGQKTLRTRAGQLDVGVPRGLEARYAVDLASRLGREPLRDLELHHDEDPLDRREALQEGQHDRHRDVVGQVGDERRRVGARELRDGERVGRDEAQLVGVLGLERPHGLLEGPARAAGPPRRP